MHLPARREQRHRDDRVDHQGRLTALRYRNPGREPQGSLFCVRGFTIIELVVVLVIVGIISVLVASRIPGAFATSSSLRDSLLAQAQYARKAAVAQRRAVFVRIEASQSRLCYTAAGACDPVMGPTGDAFAVCFDRNNCAVAPPGLAVTNVTFQFDALGRPRDNAGTLLPAPLVITVTSDDARQFRVWNETGYAEML